jgi:hypothetical protein
MEALKQTAPIEKVKYIVLRRDTAHLRAKARILVDFPPFATRVMRGKYAVDQSPLAQRARTQTVDNGRCWSPPQSCVATNAKRAVVCAKARQQAAKGLTMDAADERLLTAIADFGVFEPKANTDKERLDRLAEAGYVVGDELKYRLTVRGWALISGRDGQQLHATAK